MALNKLTEYTSVNKYETSFSLYLILLGFGFSSQIFCGLDDLLQPDYNYLYQSLFQFVLFCFQIVYALYLSLLYYDFINITSCIAYCLIYKIASCITQCVTRSPTESMMAKTLELIHHIHITLHKIIVIVQLQIWEEATGENISWIIIDQ